MLMTMKPPAAFSMLSKFSKLRMGPESENRVMLIGIASQAD